MTVPAVFAHTVSNMGNEVALRTKKLGLWKDISWKTYYTMAQYVGCALVSIGFEKGDKACIIGDNSVEWVYADMGIQCVGGVSVGIYATNAWQ